MDEKVFIFSVACNDFQNSLMKVIDTHDSSVCFSFVQNYNANQQERKAALDQAMRNALKNLIVFDKGYDSYRTLIGIAVDAVTKEMCSASTPFLMLTDIFDMMVLNDCQEMFDVIEDRVLTWKSQPFFDAGKNYLLRMCNDLIRRLSKSQNTVFCGRIQLFLSRLFPLSEKSAVNLMSLFNLENVTVFGSGSSRTANNTKSSSGAIPMECDGKSDSLVVDYNLYHKFWSLQDYFRKPTKCYDKIAWKIFVTYSDEVLTAFSSHKLDDLMMRRRDHSQMENLSNNFFAKYLTSEKLLDLQLSDSNFRRCLLVQMMILFQYLTSTVKFKGANHTLSEEQISWIEVSENTVRQLIVETPPNGDKFSSIVKHVLKCEEKWNQWKNDGCPSYERTKSKDTLKQKTRMRRRYIGEELQASGGKVIKMGNAELTRLWNINPGNMDACWSDKRQFTPAMGDFFANAIGQSDPESIVESQYKDVSNPNFQWKALRLLAQKSPHFFLSTQEPAVALPRFLNSMISKVATEMPVNGPEANAAAVDCDEEAINENQGENESLDITGEEQ